MKKILFMALVIMASAITVNVSAKNDKKQKKTETTEVAVQAVETPVTLTSAQDSVSYALGMATTNGLLNYLQQQLGLDTMYMAEFKKGFEEATQRGTDPKYTAYNAGVQIAEQVTKQILPRSSEQFEGTPLEINNEKFYQGFIAGAMNDSTLFSPTTAQKYSQEKTEAMQKIQNEATIKSNTAWLEENKTKEGVKTTASGLQYKVLTQGTGITASKDDKVTVRYEGKLIDGTVFDSSYKRTPDTTTFKPSQVIKGWTEALCMMPEGSKWELYIPQELAYGSRPAGKIKPYSALIFTVEVVKVEKAEAKTETKTETKAATTTVAPAKKVAAKKTTKK